MAFLRALVLLSLTVPGIASAAASDGQDFTPQVKALFRVAACGGGEALPQGVDAKMVDGHCQQLERSIAKYRLKWVDKAMPYLAGIVPANVPTTVVYPFGGGDLLTALATFPRASEITTLSLERAGDARSIDTLRGGKLREALGENLRNVQRLFAVAHSRTDNLSIVSKGELPGELLFVLVALKVHGYEPVSLRYFRLEADGSIHYLTADEIGTAEKAAKRKIDKLGIFANMELKIRKQGDAKAPIVTYRHLAANLDDSHLAKDPSPIEHLKKKGRVAAMTKAASYLLWWGEFSTIRNYLLANVEWMISDSTGIPPKYAVPAGFVQETYGTFDGPFLPAGRTWTADFKKLWKTNPYKELPFRYGYPDNARHSHMMVTRREKK
jgi:hypothetical protein